MEEKNKKDGQKLAFLLVVCTFIGTIMLVVGAYSLFIKKDETPVNKAEDSQQVNEKENNNSVIDTNEIKISKVEVTEETQEIVLNGKKVSLSTKDGYLYFNNKKIGVDGTDQIQIYYSTGSILLLLTSNQCGYVINYGINEDGKLIKPTFNYDSGEYYVVDDSLQVVNGKLMAKLESASEFFACEAEQCADPIPQYDVEIIYNSTKLNVNKIN